MSRFFEALREVSRSQPAAGEPTSEPQTGLNGFPGMEVPQSAAAAQAAPERPAADPDEERGGETFLDSFAPRRNDFFDKTVTVQLDKKSALITNTMDGSIVEHYRRLRTKIQQQHATKPIRSLLVASPGSGDGKTVTVMNLALSYSLLPSFKVLLIDGDLRKGTVGKWCSLNNLPGLSNVIDGSAMFEQAVLKSDQLPFHFMLSGTSRNPAAELLVSPLFGKTIRRAIETFDLVLVDSPPVNLIADAQMLASSCDGILLVARAFTTTSKAFEKTLQDLLQFRIVGTVLNGAMTQGNYYSYGY